MKIWRHGGIPNNAAGGTFANLNKKKKKSKCMNLALKQMRNDANRHTNDLHAQMSHTHTHSHRKILLKALFPHVSLQSLTHGFSGV